MILADTTIWIDHFRSGNQQMRQQLERRNIVLHPLIVAELALGSLGERTSTLAYLDGLPQLGVARLDEVRQMIESRLLYSRGIGLKRPRRTNHQLMMTPAHPTTHIPIDPEANP